jgi:hypothetical protein
VLPEHAELADLDPSLLTHGTLPGLWEEETPLKVEALYDYFDGDHAVEIPKDGYSEYESIPKADPDVLHEAIREAVSRGFLWVQQGQTSLYGEDVPDGLVGPETTLQPPPDSISPTELLPANLSVAWDNGQTTAAQLASALSDKKGEPLPWPLIRRAIDGAFQASYLTRSVESGAWPTDRAGAEQVIIQVPTEEPPGTTPPDTTYPRPQGGEETGKEHPPLGGYGSSVQRAESELEVHEIQDLADEIAEIANIAAPYGIRFHVQINAGTEDEVPDDVVARLNKALRRVSGNLEL